MALSNGINPSWLQRGSIKWQVSTSMRRLVLWLNQQPYELYCPLWYTKVQNYDKLTLIIHFCMRIFMKVCLWFSLLVSFLLLIQLFFGSLLKFCIKTGTTNLVKKFKSALVQWVFQATISNSSLYVWFQDNQAVYVLVYVDYIVLTDSSDDQVSEVIWSLSSTFPLKDLGVLNLILDIKFKHMKLGIFLSQHKYITDLLRKAIWKLRPMACQHLWFSVQCWQLHMADPLKIQFCFRIWYNNACICREQNVPIYAQSYGHSLEGSEKNFAIFE